MTIFRSRKDDRPGPSGIATTKPTCLKLNFATVGNCPLRTDPHVTGEARAGLGGVACPLRPAPLPAGDVMVRGLTWPAHRSDGKRAGSAAGGALPVQAETVTAPWCLMRRSGIPAPTRKGRMARLAPS